MAELSAEVVAAIDAGADQLHRAASAISGSRLDLERCAELGTSVTHILASLVTVTERLAEGVATLGTRTRLRHELGEDPVRHLTGAAHHLGDVRATLSSAVAAAGHYRNEILSLQESRGPE